VGTRSTPERGRVRLCSWNIQRGLELEGVCGVLEREPVFRDSDIIAIQEASFTPDGESMLARMAAVLGPDHHWVYSRVMEYPDKEYGNGLILAPHCSVDAVDTILLPQVRDLGWLERMKTEGGRPDTKSAMVAEVRHPVGRVRVANVHLDFAGGWPHRRKQLEVVLERLEEPGETQPPTIAVVCGDFNATGHYRLAPSRKNTERALEAAAGLGFADATRDVEYTSDLFGNVDPEDPSALWLNAGKWLGASFRQKTDHVLIRPSAGHVVGHVIQMAEESLFQLSDHLPIAAEVHLDP